MKAKLILEYFFLTKTAKKNVLKKNSGPIFLMMRLILGWG